MIKPIVFFTDFHAHIFEDYAKPDIELVNDRFRAQMDTLQQVFSIARHYGADVVFGGDMFHKRGKIEDVVFNSVYEIVANNSDIQVHMVRGNHDSKNNTTNSPHWLETFKYLSHVRVYPKPTMTLGNGYTIAAIPYSDDIAYLKDCISTYAETAKGIQNTILVAHVGVDGAETGRYSHRLEGAFTVGDLYPEAFTYVALGHYHKRQFLAGTDNVFYGGNTIQTSFSDEGQDKGVFLLDWKSKPQFIPIKNKQFITLDHIPENVQEIVDNNYVRFILPKEQAQEVAILKEESDNIRIEIKKEYQTETRIDIGMESTEEEIVKAYTADKYPHVTQLALDILAEAKAS
jgi:DNA repair exonuclease SbcCD nuclease subunit